ncbi:MAG TPA: hypothetical protein VHV28_05380 [Solirubrobacteraceae bacterium]|jgi:hypothetical protein|nr:hypothetical protein [Solirubrobacteraceae bacterium]
MRRALAGAALSAALAVLLAGCFDVQSADLFLLTRTGQGATLTLLINDGGTIRCDGGKAKPVSNSTLITARDLSDNLATDAQDKLTIPNAPGSVYYYRIRLEQGTISFPDKASATRNVLAQAELFAAKAAQQDCGLSG